MAATAMFLALWWNRYVGVSLAGYFSLYGSLIASGKVPYRDFFLHVPPLQALVDAAVEACFGRSLLVVNTAAALGRVMIAGLLALWLARRFRPTTAFLVSVAVVCIGSNDYTEILDLYNFHAVLALVAAGLAAAKALDDGPRSGRWWLAAGCAAAIAFWTKQTIGLAALLATPTALCILAARDRAARRLAPGRLGRYAMGIALPTVVLGSWLAWNGAFAAFLRETFTDAAASKGAPSELLVRAWATPFQISLLTPSAAIAVGVSLVLLIAFRLPNARARSLRLLAVAGVGALLLLAIGWWLGRHLSGGDSAPALAQLRLLKQTASYLGHYGSLLLATYLAIGALRGTLAPRDRDLLLMSVTGAACSASLAMSFPGGYTIALPALAPVAAWACDGEARARWLAPLRALPLLLIAGGMVAGVAIGALAPFDFAGWCEPPLAQSTVRSSLPELRGMLMSASTRDALERTTELVRAASRPDEPILVFPVAAFFYWLTDRRPATFAAVHWFDVTPDRIVLSDSELVRRSPPPVIIRQWLTGPYIKIHENFFRHGQASELRMMNESLNALLGERYTWAFSFAPGCAAAPPYQVWVRSDRYAGLAPPVTRSSRVRPPHTSRSIAPRPLPLL